MLKQLTLLYNLGVLQVGLRNLLQGLPWAHYRALFPDSVRINSGGWTGTLPFHSLSASSPNQNGRIDVQALYVGTVTCFGLCAVPASADLELE